jgi:HPt (histidine-containing phosphotransfer) domain-containing protein
MSVDIKTIHDPIYSDFKDDEDFIDLVNLFVNSMSEKIELMRQAFRENNVLSLQTYAHQLKGSGTGYGFSDLSTLASDLEESCKNNDILKMTADLETIINYMSHISC